MTSKYALIGLCLAGLALSVPAGAQPDGEDTEAPPRIVGVNIYNSRYAFDFAYDFAFYDFFYEDFGSLIDFWFFGYWETPELFDPYTDIAEELDLITVDMLIEDPGLPDDALFIWNQADSYLVTSPESPPLLGATQGYLAYGGYTLVDENTALITASFVIPQLLGPSQDRLRGLIDFDAGWFVEIRVANDESPEDGKWDALSFPLYAIERASFRPANPPPFSATQADKVVAVNSTVILDGELAFDSSNFGFDPSSEDVFEKDTINYTWEWMSGPVRVDPLDDGDGNPATFAVTLNVPGIFVYRLLVDDGINPAVSTSTISIDVRAVMPTNAAPVAVVDSPQEAVVSGATITLDASGSVDSDGDELLYFWKQVNELGGDLAPDQIMTTFQPVSGSQEPISTWRALEPGEYHFRLLVVDQPELRDYALVGQQASDTEVVSVTVVEPTALGTQLANDGSGQDLPGLGTLPACGGSLLPLAMLPLLLWLARGRYR
jgi:hypothetical protein